MEQREAVTCHVDISTWQAEMDRGSDRVIDPGSHTSLLYICPRKAVTAILLPARTRANQDGQVTNGVAHLRLRE